MHNSRVQPRGKPGQRDHREKAPKPSNFLNKKSKIVIGLPRGMFGGSLNLSVVAIYFNAPRMAVK